jgi:hypothetical protein
MNAVAGAILVAFGLFLISLAVVVFAKPVVAERFFMSFASSARAHYTEQVVRLQKKWAPFYIACNRLVTPYSVSYVFLLQFLVRESPEGE